MQPTREIHYNKPQLKTWLIDAHESWHIWGRGTGKSEGVIAPKSLRNIHSMKRSAGGFIAATYQQLLTRTLPPVIAGWERLGYKKDLHFFVGKKPPKSWAWKEPYVAPISYDYFISWYNGSGINMISQDRPGSSNGLSLDYVMGDEAKFLNKEKLETELFPTNRGNNHLFGHLPEHHGLLFCTDLPTSPSAKWILDKREQMDVDLVNVILQIQLKIFELNEILKKCSPSYAQKIKYEIIKYSKQLTELRMDCVYYSEASALDNIEVLGIKYIKQMKRTLPEMIYRTSILNERIIAIEDGFYPNFEESIHCYDSYNYSYLDSLDYNFDKLKQKDCRQDGDLMLDHPIHGACDYGASINLLVLGQKQPKEIKYLNMLYVLKPELINDVAADFCDYYEYHRNKTFHYHYDHTAIGTDGKSTSTYADEFEGVLRKRGWNVIRNYIGQAPRHHNKYKLWALALKGDPRLPSIRFNRTNCEFLIISMQQAPVKNSKNGFEKDKSSEVNLNIKPQEATHPSDAADTLLYGMCSTNLTESTEFIDIVLNQY